MSNNGPAFAPRRRLDVDERRAQLLRVAAEQFATRPYTDVWVEHVATAAGVSRGLLYHYFGSKNGLLAAVVQHQADQLFDHTRPEPTLPPERQLRASLAGYLNYVTDHPHGYRALYHGSSSADHTVRAITRHNLDEQADRILTTLPDAYPSSAAKLIVNGWLGFLVAACLEWLDNPSISRDAFIELNIAVLKAGLRQLPGA